jgi:hypothetical protein
MRRFLLFAILAMSAVAAASAQPSVPPKENSGQWSEAVDQIRGRLIAEAGLDDHGRTEVRVFLELQNLAELPVFGMKISVQHQQSFDWEVKGPTGESVPRWTGPVPWIFDGGFIPFWISIPARSSLRFPVTAISYNVLQPSNALVLGQNLPGPPWHLASGGKTYSLSAKFKGVISGEMPSQFVWSGPLSLPPVAMPSDFKPRIWK